ncbi:23S rRNA (uracil(1939)-C(5))-methyltransferase RlmD [Alicyclobacillus macrosporangiidus]|nr:23S rRNA (uracil(1939)-C(5))-methyltransferase RlmD [Alicyclobacillus macrosporangiidus]
MTGRGMDVGPGHGAGPAGGPPCEAAAGPAGGAGAGMPVRPGDRYAVEAVRLNDDGDGVASVGGLTVFVPGLLPGEQADIEITAVERRFARGRIVLRRGDAQARVAPPCAAFGICGGCQLQHLAYDAQLAHKREVVVQALRRIARMEGVTVHPTLGMAAPWRYRNQVQVPLSFDPATRSLTPAFFAPGSHALVPVPGCHLEPVEMERTIRAVADELTSSLGARAARVHHLIVRQSFTTGAQMVVFAAEAEDVPLEEVAQRVLAIPPVVSVARTVQPNRHGLVWGRTVDVLAGDHHLTERIGDLEFLISPRSFFQVNTLQARRLYETALAYAEVRPGDRVLDGYCGTGTLALMFARRVRQVAGIEAVAAAVADARVNAAHNGIDNASFVTGQVERVLPRWTAEGRRFDVVLLDPPRRGCDRRVLDAVLEARPRRVVYVSCNPATLARDLRVLCDGGYHVAEVQPVDMFPQTSHVECCAQLIREDGDKK